MSDSRITARDVQSWSWFTGITPELWERRALRALDNAWMRAKRV